MIHYLCRVFLCGAVLGAVGMQAPPVFQSIEEQAFFVALTEAAGWTDARALATPTIQRSRPVRIDVEHLTQVSASPDARLVLDLFDDVFLTLQVEGSEVRSPAGVTAWGSVVGEPGSSFTLVAREGVVAANVRIPGQWAHYQIRYLGEGVHAVREIDETAFPACAGAVEPTAPGLQAPVLGQERTEGCEDDGSFVDVLVLYTPAARDEAGGTTQMEALIDLAIAETNAAYAKSLIDTRLRLAYQAETDYDEDGSFGQHLDALRAICDGSIDEVFALRRMYRADLVCLLVADDDYCGQAVVMTELSPDFEYYAYSVVAQSCATGHYSFGHELGHNMGCAHDRDNTSRAGVYDYSYGYQDPGEVFRTVMAYPCPGECPRVDHFSNPDPDADYSGLPTGVPVEDLDAAANNALTINNVALTVANFRKSNDCNDNGVCDATDLAGRTSMDCNGNGIPDECEVDCNHNGLADECDIVPFLFVDTSPGKEFTTPNDSVSYTIFSPPMAQTDVTIRVEAENAPPGDITFYFPGGEEVGAGSWSGAVCGAQSVEVLVPAAVHNAQNPAGHQVLIVIQGDLTCSPPSTLVITTSYTTVPSADCNDNGVPDECEQDCDGNGAPDDCDLASPGRDCNANGVLDDCEAFRDWDGNGEFDPCDIVTGALTDLNGDGIPDESQGPLPCDLGKFGAPAGTGGGFGFSVAADGDDVVIGTWSGRDNGAFAYRWSGLEWVDLETIRSEVVPASNFGWSVDVDGDVIVVGIMGEEAAYVHWWDGAAWRDQRLTAWDGAGDVYFGKAVAVSSDAIAVGALWGDNPTEHVGAVYVFYFNPVTHLWEAGTKVTTPSGEGWDNFGETVAIDGGRLAVGAPHVLDGHYGVGNGAVYVFERNAHGPGTIDDTWDEIAILAAPDTNTESFGDAISISGDVILVGAPFSDPHSLGKCGNSGLAYVYRKAGDTWVEQKLGPLDPHDGYRFGSSVSVSGDVCVVGALREESGGLPSAGSAYIFRWNGARWYPERRLTQPEAESYDYFGNAVSISGDLLLVGAYGAGVYGTVYAYALTDSDCTVEVATETDLDNGQDTTLNPGGGSGEAWEDAQVWIRNDTGPNNATVTVTETSEELHPESGFGGLGTTLSITTSLYPGEFLMRVMIPFTALDVVESGWRSARLAWYDETLGDWVPAGSGLGSELHGTAMPTLSGELGDHGVFWNTDMLTGFVWANVNHTSDFAAGASHSHCDYDGDDDVDLSDHSDFSACATSVGGGPVAWMCGAFDIDRDGDVDFRDWATFQNSFAGSPPTDVCIDLTAEVDSVEDWHNVLGGALNVGQVITGRYIYDSTTADSNASPNVGEYWHFRPPYGITLNAGPLEFGTDPSNVEFLVEILNAQAAPARDGYALWSFSNLPASAAVAVDYISWRLEDPTLTALSSDALPMVPPVLSDWESVLGVGIEGCAMDEFDEFGFCMDSLYFIWAHVTSVRLCSDAGGRRDGEPVSNRLKTGSPMKRTLRCPPRLE